VSEVFDYIEDQRSNVGVVLGNEDLNAGPPEQEA
jgi:hypothetical protein